MKEVLELLLQNGWVEDGTTRLQSFRTASPAYGGGSVVTLGGRIRLKREDWSVTVGKRTTCFYRKPENPETLQGRGRMAGRKVYTFRDWEQNNMPTKNIEDIKAFILSLVKR